jgi:hypothetical protein
LPLSGVSWLYATIGGRASTATPAPKEISMPPAKNSISRSSHPATFKEPAALKWLSSSLDTAQQALVELREDTGRDVSQGARDLHKDLRAFISSARRDTGKLAKALQRDFEHAQKQLAQRHGHRRRISHQDDDRAGLAAVARRLQDDGLVRKSGAELHPTA